ncbi:hypothetical protein BGW41_006032 [Actinomortierella wolfii]|nr:hypothetical protein BGW41_006032 [Actinomortierella wolfii]
MAPNGSSVRSSNTGDRHDTTSSSLPLAKSRPSFSITLPPSKSKDNAAVARTIVFDGVDDHRQAALRNRNGGHRDNEVRHQQQTPEWPNDDPPVRRRSVQFMPGDEDTLADHEHQSMLPKTPYPTNENPMESSSSTRRSSSPFAATKPSKTSSPSASSLHLPHPPDDHTYHHNIVHHFSASPPSSSSSSTSPSPSVEEMTSESDKKS